MISSEVQRTLVKSPPELWAEISDPESLARHLGEFGEIRITRVQPEQKVEWEADDASGTVVIKPSGWGTKVKLTVTRELAQPELPDESPVATGDEPNDEQPSAHVVEQAADEPAQEVELEAADTTALADEPEEVIELHDELESDAEDAPMDVATPEPEPEPEPRRGFFARLFGRRRAHAERSSAVELVEPAPQPIASEPIEDELLSARLDEPECAFVDEPAHDHDHERELEAAPCATADEPTETGAQPLDELATEPGTRAIEQAVDSPEASADPAEQVASDDASTQTKLAEELAAEEVTAVLTGVLDRLGAAHHRPFSRA
jgi:hypothetical protein